MSKLRHDPRRVAIGLTILLLAGFCNMYRSASAQSNKAAQIKNAPTSSSTLKRPLQPGKQKDEYHRPDPIRPLTPQIPSTPRQRPDQVFLEKADSMIKYPMAFRNRQIVMGNVQFRQMGTWLFCDSAYYYPDENSLDAYGHVQMRQGDTLFVYADKVYYDGTTRFARLRNGPSEPKVRLVNRKVSLTTDSLDYSLLQELGWYTTGGVLKDGGSTLTSEYGSYSPRTKDADFYHKVVVLGDRNDFQLYTDTLFYNTATHIARIVTPTRILTTDDEVITSSGFYNTQSGVAELMSRSTILHTDSLFRTTTLEGDSIVYDPARRVSEAFQFRDPLKRGRPMILTDTARKAILIGGYGYYNDITREAMATHYPLMMEYSRGDTLFLRADTILTMMLPYPEPADTTAQTDSLTAENAIRKPAVRKSTSTNSNSGLDDDSTWHYAKAYPRARFFRNDMQGVADTIIFTELDSLLRLKRLPVAWNENRQVRGDSIIIHLKDSTADWARIPGHARLMELIEDDYFDQLHSDKMMMWFEEGTLKHLEAEGSVETIMLPQESDSTYNRLVNAESSFLTIDMDGNNLKHLKMWPEVNGTVTPLFLVKKSQKLLNGAQWLEAIRPRREWYGGRVQWADDLGELPEALEDYFEQ